MERGEQGMSSIEEKVVSMKFDNKNFTREIDNAIKSLIESWVSPPETITYLLSVPFNCFISALESYSNNAFLSNITSALLLYFII